MSLLCRTLLEDLAEILDKIQLVIRLLRLTMDMEPTDENPQWEIDEKLDMLQHHLVANTETMDYLFSVQEEEDPTDSQEVLVKAGGYFKVFENRLHGSHRTQKRTKK